MTTTLRYPDEVIDPSHFAEIRDLPESNDEESASIEKIVDKMTTDLDLSIFHDDCKERIEALIKAKMKGEIAQVKEKRPKTPVAERMMEALRDGRILEVTFQGINLIMPANGLFFPVGKKIPVFRICTSLYRFI